MHLVIYIKNVNVNAIATLDVIANNLKYLVQN